MQIVNAFGQVQNSLSYIVNAYTDIAAWKATADRLVSFSQAIRQANSVGGFIPSYTDSDQIDAKELTIKLPDGQVLLENLNLHLIPGDSLLITGPSGCGKTTLLRTLAGIWPFAKGELSLPAITSMMFLPQKPYLPLDTLKGVLCYPKADTVISNDEARALLQLCQLGHLYAKLGDDYDWSRMLSVGEQQRIGIARAILAKPNFLFLDEATSGLDEAAESYLYQLLRTQCPNTCIISVGHRGTLKLGMHENCRLFPHF